MASSAMQGSELYTFQFAWRSDVRLASTTHDYIWASCDDPAKHAIRAAFTVNFVQNTPAYMAFLLAFYSEYGPNSDHDDWACYNPSACVMALIRRQFYYTPLQLRLWHL